MTNYINVYDKKDPVHGVLSNNYVSEFTIDDISYKTPSNFIFSNILKERLNFNLLRNMNPISNDTTIEREFNNYLNKMELENLKSSLKHAYISKILADGKMKSYLKNTGDSNLIYVGGNDVELGQVLKDPKSSDKDPKNYTGENFIGNLLMQLRQSHVKDMEIAKKREEDKSMLITMYFNYVFLKKQILKDNTLESFLDFDVRKKFVNDGDGSILTVQDTKDIEYNNIVNLLKTNLELKNVLELTKNVNYKILVAFLRKNNLKKLHLKLEKIKNEIIYEQYMTYLIKDVKKHSLKNKKEFSTILRQSEEGHSLGHSLTQLETVKTRLATQYDLGNKLPTKVQNTAGTLIGNSIYTNISEETLNSLEPEFKSLSSQNIISEKQIKKTSSNSKPIFISNSSQLLHPQHFSEIFKIDNNNYPTIQHYAIMSAILLYTPHKHINSIYYDYMFPDKQTKKMLNLNELYQRFMQTKFNFIYTRKQRLLKVVLEKKFSNIFFINSLLNTKNIELLNVNNFDPTLGINIQTKQGYDLLGKELMNIRQKLQQNTRTYDMNYNLENIDKIVNNNFVIRFWIQNKFLELKTICELLHEYLILKSYSIDKPRSAEINNLVSLVIQTFYKKCLSNSDNIHNSVSFPPAFLSSFASKQNSNVLTTESIQIMWNFMTIILSKIESHNKSTLKVSTLTSVIQNSYSSRNDPLVCKNIIDNEKYNCILLSVSNIVLLINKLLSEYSKSKEITSSNLEFLLAKSILLNNNYFFKSKSFLNLKNRIANEEISINDFSNFLDIASSGDVPMTGVSKITQASLETEEPELLHEYEQSQQDIISDVDLEQEQIGGDDEFGEGEQDYGDDLDDLDDLGLGEGQDLDLAPKILQKDLAKIKDYCKKQFNNDMDNITFVLRQLLLINTSKIPNRNTRINFFSK